MRTYSGIIAIPAGATSLSINILNMPQPPIAAAGTVMKKGAGSANLFAVPDFSSFTYQGGTFYFDSAIPSDGNTYLLFYVFHLWILT